MTNIITLDDFEKELRSYIGTPFHHGGRVPGKDGGLDCGGMITVAMSRLGMTIEDVVDYPQGDGMVMMVQMLEKHCVLKNKLDAVEPGDLILLRDRGMYHHLIYWTQNATIINAWQTSAVNKVVETDMPYPWWNSIDSVWRLRELEQWQQ